MTFVDSVRTCFIKYADFMGCASRSEFWWWTLFTVIAGFVFNLTSETLSLIFSLGTLVPSLAVGARRLHETDRSGWLQVLWLVPVVGWILLIYWFAQEPKAGNRYQLAVES